MDESKMKYAILNYKYSDDQKLINIGDYIQSLAASQFLPEGFNQPASGQNQSILINRENLSGYKGEAVRMIMNGWYMHQPEHWPPASQIDPLFVALHICRSSQGKMLSPSGVSYLKQHEPIGCRDLDTLSMLEENEIDAYYSACMTLTLDERYLARERTDEILFVDPCLREEKSIYGRLHERITRKDNKMLLSIPIESKTKPKQFYRLYSQLFPEKILQESTYIRHQIPKEYFLSDVAKFQYAETLLHRYASAKLVITSRIHCALPCLALKTPVIYINDMHIRGPLTGRVEGLLDLFNVVNLRQGRFSSRDIDLKELFSVDKKATENKIDYRLFAQNLKKTCRQWLENGTNR